MAYAPYPTYPSYLDFISLAPSPLGSTQVVRTPRITNQGVMQSEVSEVGAGASAGPPSPEATALSTGDAVVASTAHATGIPGLNFPGMVPGMFQGSNAANQGNRALALLGLMDPSMAAGLGSQERCSRPSTRWRASARDSISTQPPACR
jgi:hypothetical protein